MSFQWKDKVVLITGAASGIGAQLVKIILDEGVKHVAILDIAVVAARSLESELNSKYGSKKVRFIKCDVTDDNELFGAYKSVIDDFGNLDVVVNNAGLCNESLAKYKKQMEINFMAVVTSTIKALELMRKDHGGKGGTVINIASVAGIYKVLPFATYCGTKAAVLHFSNSIGDKDYYEKTGVRIFSMTFGGTATPLYSAQNMGHYDKDLEKILPDIMKAHPHQSCKAASQAIADAYKQAEPGSVWASRSDLPVENITPVFDKSYELFSPYVGN